MKYIPKCVNLFCGIVTWYICVTITNCRNITVFECGWVRTRGTGRILFPYLDQLIRNGLFLDDSNINIGALQHSNAYVFETGLFIIKSGQFSKLTNGPYINKLSYVSIWFLPSARRPRTSTFKFQYHFKPFTFFWVSTYANLNLEKTAAHLSLLEALDNQIFDDS